MKTILLAPYLWDVYLCFKKVGVTSAFLVKHGGTKNTKSICCYKYSSKNSKQIFSIFKNGKNS